jgi:hypothetical protein
MGMIEDVLKALERIPAWKRLSAVPAEVDALTRRVAALEARLAPATGDACPRCRAMAFALIESRPEPEPWGSMGSREYVYRCSACQYEDVKKQSAG